MPSPNDPSISIRPDREPRTWILEARCVVGTPLEEVFPFFSDARNLERLTPPWVGFEVLSKGDLAMTQGLLIDYRIRIHGVPIIWRTEITEWDPPHRFQDTQLKGPYALWEHTHRFMPATTDTTVMTDVIRYRPKGGPFAPLINRALVARDVRRIFEYRSTVLHGIFGRPQPVAR